MNKRLQALVAMSPTGVIGNLGKIPWYIKTDLQRFRTNTLHAPIIMGRKTYESIGKPLGSRTNIVLSKDAKFKPDGVSVFSDFNNALTFATSLSSKVSIVGGAEVYKLAWNVVDTLLLTLVPYVGTGDTTCEFPDVPWYFQSIDYFRKQKEDTHSHFFIALTKQGTGIPRTMRDWIKFSLSEAL